MRRKSGKCSETQRHSHIRVRSPQTIFMKGRHILEVDWLRKTICCISLSFKYITGKKKSLPWQKLKILQNLSGLVFYSAPLVRIKCFLGLVLSLILTSTFYLKFTPSHVQVLLWQHPHSCLKQWKVFTTPTSFFFPFWSLWIFTVLLRFVSWSVREASEFWNRGKKLLE